LCSEARATGRAGLNEIDRAQIQLADRWILSRLNTVIAQ